MYIIYSAQQLRALRYFARYPMPVERLALFNQVTIGSLFKRKLLRQVGDHIGPTGRGFQELEMLNTPDVRKRKYSAPISLTCRKFVRLRSA